MDPLEAREILRLAAMDVPDASGGDHAWSEGVSDGVGGGVTPPPFVGSKGHGARAAALEIATPRVTTGSHLPRLDTIQFPRRVAGTSWGSETFTEIVLLAPWAREMSFLHSALHHTHRLMCGRYPWLRPCRLTDVAVLAHGPSCARQAPPDGLLERANCSANITNDLRRRFIAAKHALAMREAMRLEIGDGAY